MKKIRIYILGLLILYSGISSAQFITTWKTDNPGSSNDNQITIPTFSAETYNYTVDWGDGNSDANVSIQIIHTYASPGIYTVTITGLFPRIFFNAGGFFGSNNDHDKLLTIEQWGNNPWTSMNKAFSGCTNLRINATDAPNLSTVTDLSYMFRECESLNDDISSWDVSNVTTMIGVFRKASSFNQPLNAWDVSGVTTMSELFFDAVVFNQPLNLWDVSTVEDMSDLFFFANSFNGDINNWEMGNVTNMTSMFGGATVFNQNISGWDVRNVVNMNQMFSWAQNFDANISNWETNSLLGITYMFSGASAFNQDISGWNISNVSSLSGLFKDATTFNQDLSGWMSSFPTIEDMSFMFDGATAFDQNNISGWDVGGVIYMENMFANSTFNPNITSWNVGNVSNFNGMFENNTAFNQPIGIWNVSSATDMRSMFSGASSFDQDLGGWDVSNVTLMFNMLNGAGLSVGNYDKLLTGWVLLTLQNGVNFGASNLFYCAAATARAELISTYSWFITDAGLGCIAVFEGTTTTGPEIFNAQPEAIDFGSINFSGTKSLDFTIENKLAVDITNFSVTISTNTGGAFSVTTTPPTIIAAGTPLTISIDFTGLTIVSFSETVTFFYNPVVGLSSSFSFDITGEVTAALASEIAVFEGNTTAGNVIVSSGNLSLPTTIKDTNATTQITIENKGSDTLKISSFSLYSGSEFSISPNTAANLPVDSTQTYTITLDATTAGYFTDTLAIGNNDSNESNFTINLSGIIEGPDIEVFDGPDIYNDPQIADGQGYTIDFESAFVGTNITRQVAIVNYGLADLTISDIQVNAPFSVSVSNLTVPAMVDYDPSIDTIEIVLSGIAPGSFNELITIMSDDDAKPNFEFFLMGEIIDPYTPKAYWTDGFQINRSNLDGTGFEEYHTETSGYSPQGIAIDTLRDVIYWTTNGGNIKKGEINAEGFINISDFMNDGIDTNREMGGIALDVTGDKIYWASSHDGTIKSADLSSNDPANVTITPIVTGLEFPTSVAVDPANNLLYYTTNFSGVGNNLATLHQVDLSNNTDVVLHSTQVMYNDFFYYDVKLDLVNKTIYWSELNSDIYSPTGSIYYANLANITSTVTSYSTITNRPSGIDLDVKNKKIYWTDLQPYMGQPAIGRANLDGTLINTLQTGFPNLNNPLYIALDLSSCTTSPTANAGADQTVCPSGAVSLTGVTTGATTNNWLTSGDGVFTNANLLNTTYQPGPSDRALGTVTLTLTAIFANCPPAIDQIDVMIYLPISVINQFDTVTINDSIVIDVFNGGFVNNDDVITTTILAQPQKGLVNINANGTITYTALEGNLGTDTFDFQIKNQCNQTASATATITIPNTAPSFNDGSATTIPGVPVTINIIDLITDLNGNIDLSSIQIIQQPGSGAPATLDANNNLVVDYTGMIFFGVDEVVIEVCDFDSVCTEASIFITVEALPIEAYNAVSPNGDGKHDFLEFRYIEAYPTNNVKIFNRWGDIVFEIEDYNNQDKIFTGIASVGGAKELPTGTYYYTVVLKLPTDEFETVKGYFELRR